MKSEDLGHDEAMALWLASLAGVPDLARQLQRLCLSDDSVSIEDPARSSP